MIRDNGMTAAMTRCARVAVLVLTVSPAVADAQPVDSAKVQAQAALREGNALLGQGRATDALMKFTEAYRLFPSPKLHYNIGQAQTLIPGHEAQAYESMSRFLNEATDANPELRAAAETQRHQLRAKVGLVSIVAEPADADLLVDDVNVGKASRDVPVVIGIGTHRLALKKDDAVSSPETVTISGGATSEARLVLAPAGASLPRVPPALPASVPVSAPVSVSAAPGAVLSSPAPSAPPADRVDDAGGSDQRPIYRSPWFWGGLAAVAVAGGLTALLIARSPDKNPSPSLGTYPSGN